MSTDEITNAEAAAAPSADWVKAVSEYLDTDPADLLAELGYYDRPEETRTEAEQPVAAPFA